MLLLVMIINNNQLDYSKKRKNLSPVDETHKKLKENASDKIDLLLSCAVQDSPGASQHLYSVLTRTVPGLQQSVLNKLKKVPPAGPDALLQAYKKLEANQSDRLDLFLELASQCMKEEKKDKALYYYTKALELTEAPSELNWGILRRITKIIPFLTAKDKLKGLSVTIEHLEAGIQNIEDSVSDFCNLLKCCLGYAYRLRNSPDDVNNSIEHLEFFTELQDVRLRVIFSFALIESLFSKWQADKLSSDVDSMYENYLTMVPDFQDASEDGLLKMAKKLIEAFLVTSQKGRAEEVVEGVSPYMKKYVLKV